MTITDAPPSSTDEQFDADVAAFIDQATRDAALAIKVFRETGTVSANGTVNFVERIPGHELAIALNDPGPWAADPTVSPIVATFDGEVVSGSGHAGFVGGYKRLFRERPEITTVLHIHTPWLGGWAQTHRELPFNYAASLRLTLSRVIPHHIDRSQPAADFILEELESDPHLAAIFEANGGVNVIGRQGLLELAKFTVLLEEGAQFQAIGETLGGSVAPHPTNLAAQWSRTGLLEEGRRLGYVPAAE